MRRWRPPSSGPPRSPGTGRSGSGGWCRRPRRRRRRGTASGRHSWSTAPRRTPRNRSCGRGWPWCGRDSPTRQAIPRRPTGCCWTRSGPRRGRRPIWPTRCCCGRSRPAGRPGTATWCSRWPPSRASWMCPGRSTSRRTPRWPRPSSPRTRTHRCPRRRGPWPRWPCAGAPASRAPRRASRPGTWSQATMLRRWHSLRSPSEMPARQARSAPCRGCSPRSRRAAGTSGTGAMPPPRPPTGCASHATSGSSRSSTSWPACWRISRRRPGTRCDSPPPSPSWTGGGPPRARPGSSGPPAGCSTSASAGSTRPRTGSSRRP